MVASGFNSDLLQSYIALGLEPGAAWDDIQERYKELVMVWHPDRFAEDKRKQRADDELKKINHARDRLRKHFRKEHKRKGGCQCQAYAFWAYPEAANVPTRMNSQWWHKHSGSWHFSMVLALFALACATLTLAGKVAGHIQAPLAMAPVSYSSDNGSVSFADVNVPASQPRESDNRRLDPASDSEFAISKRLDTQTPGGMYSLRQPRDLYARLVLRDNDRRQKNLDSQRITLQQRIAKAENAMTISSESLKRVTTQLAIIDDQMQEHKSIIKEIEQVDSDLQGTNVAIGSWQYYVSDPEYRRHSDAYRDLFKTRQELEEVYRRQRQRIEEEKTSSASAKEELAEIAR